MRQLATYAAVCAIWFAAGAVSFAPAQQQAAQPSVQPCVTDVQGDYHQKRAALMRQLVLIQEQIVQLDRAAVGMQNYGNEYRHKQEDK